MDIIGTLGLYNVRRQAEEAFTCYQAGLIRASWAIYKTLILSKKQMQLIGGTNLKNHCQLKTSLVGHKLISFVLDIVGCCLPFSQVS